MTSAAKKLKKPNKTAPFKEYILYYMKRKGWSQSTLAQYARLSQSNVCKIINGNYERTKMESFVSLFLVLQLTVNESKDLLSRAERAFSPASELHTVYKDLIWYYSTIHDDTDILTMLDYADKYLMDRGYDPLPNSFIAKGREKIIISQALKNTYSAVESEKSGMRDIIGSNKDLWYRTRQTLASLTGTEKGEFLIMLNIRDLKIDNASLGQKMLLVEVIPAYEYKDKQRTDTITGYRYVVCLVDHHLEKLSVRIDGPQLMEQPDGFVEVEFDGLEVRAYENKGVVNFTAKATGIFAV